MSLNTLFIIVLIIGSYSTVALLVYRDYKTGKKHHKATLSYRLWGILPRYTVRLPNGRFKANKVGFWYVATH
ncbi:hypothetical protein HOS39_gp02 [Pectobacterium phage DU_PP_II]|uniref:Uncharacterized protein n=1 Tax=Pectobacterium phage DU_PP_II TaxID=2041489 RepID=A0A2D2W5S7_9CAUD|nr:hypothetical protein HOS39_gp02 [Pectobacterium phage DU_PP_II]ATS93669.1 hypothetical protein P2B40kb_p002 [Pectobacterium phage DU_PP_II]